MVVETIMGTGADRITDSYNRREETRITLPIRLYLRRSINDSSYRHEVQTDNVSSHGARVICDVPLKIGTELEVYGFNDRFSATALVRHVELRRDGRWSVGLEFLNKSGSWVVR